MNKTFEYELGKVAVTMSKNIKVNHDDMKTMCLVDITECRNVHDISVMDQKELGEYIKFLQEVRTEMIEIDKKEGAK
ncbi:hypothetical protein EMIT079MI2_300034 [Bacillus sp. IT-79MI2]|uniref:hypothetical protein n=1 Tax=Bacillus sp. IT-79MI2 TaxID=3026438 RepID=UPI0039E01FDA